MRACAIPSGIIVSFDFSGMILVDGVVAARKHVIWCSLENRQLFCYVSELGDDLNSCGPSANNGDTFALEIDLLRWPS